MSEPKQVYHIDDTGIGEALGRVRVLEFDAQLVRLASKADRTINITLNLPEASAEAAAVLTTWANAEVRVLLEFVKVEEPREPTTWGGKREGAGHPTSNNGYNQGEKSFERSATWEYNGEEGTKSAFRFSCHQYVRVIADERIFTKRRTSLLL